MILEFTLPNKLCQPIQHDNRMYSRSYVLLGIMNTLKKILDEASATDRFAIDLHHKYTIDVMERTLLSIAVDNNFPGKGLTDIKLTSSLRKSFTGRKQADRHKAS